MTVRVERRFDVDASPERVWNVISDPELRARSISVVTDYRIEDDEGRKAVWTIRLPIPFVNTTIDVRTQDVERRPPEYVKFVGRSKVMTVTGEHEIEPTETGSRVINRFVVDGKLPGVERFFRHNLDDELDNIEATMREAATA